MYKTQLLEFTHGEFDVIAQVSIGTTSAMGDDPTEVLAIRIDGFPTYLYKPEIVAAIEEQAREEALAFSRYGR